jgi:hypothetical protein
MSSLIPGYEYDTCLPDRQARVLQPILFGNRGFAPNIQNINNETPLNGILGATK